MDSAEPEIVRDLRLTTCFHSYGHCGLSRVGPILSTMLNMSTSHKIEPPILTNTNYGTCKPETPYLVISKSSNIFIVSRGILHNSFLPVAHRCPLLLRPLETTLTTRLRYSRTMARTYHKNQRRCLHPRS